MTKTQSVPMTMPQARRQWLIRTLIALLWMIGPPIWAAGTLHWPWFWAFVILLIIGQSANTLLLLRYSPDLLIERVRRDHESKPWDRPLVLWAVVVLPLVCLIVCGLDRRFDWTQASAWTGWLPWLGLVMAASGHALTDWAMLSNAWFSALVRIQSERDHQVATGGPYRYVRHPGYVGATMFQMATPLILGSAWALLPALIACALIIVRTSKEDATLQAELEGYVDYTQNTRWRLLPGVW